MDIKSEIRSLNWRAACQHGYIWELLFESGGLDAETETRVRTANGLNFIATNLLLAAKALLVGKVPPLIVDDIAVVFPIDDQQLRLRVNGIQPPWFGLMHEMLRNVKLAGVHLLAGGVAVPAAAAPEHFVAAACVLMDVCDSNLPPRAATTT